MKRILLMLLLCCMGAWATVPSVPFTVTYTCSGGFGPFPFNFPISDPTAMTVTLNGVLLPTMGYTVVALNNNFNNGGSVTLGASHPCVSGQLLVLTRSTPITQSVQYYDNMPIPNTTFGRGLDKLTEIAQELNRHGGGTANYQHNGSPVATEPSLNFLDTTGVFTVTDDPTNTRVNVSISSLGNVTTTGLDTTPVNLVEGGGAATSITNADITKFTLEAPYIYRPNNSIISTGFFGSTMTTPTGTPTPVINGVVVLVNQGGVTKAIPSTVSQTNIPAYIVGGFSGTGGSPYTEIAVSGSPTCQFDGIGGVVGNYVGVSTNAAGRCMDFAVSAFTSPPPSGVFTIGILGATVAPNSTADVILLNQFRTSGAGIASINGDTTSAQVIAGAGTVSCSTSAGTTTCTGSSGGSGTVLSGSGYKLSDYASGASTTVGPTNIASDSTGNNLNVPGNTNVTGSVNTGASPPTICGTGVTGCIGSAGGATRPTPTAGMCSLDPNSTNTAMELSCNGGAEVPLATVTPKTITFQLGTPGGTALSTGILSYITVPFNCTINGWNIAVDAGTATIKFLKVAAGTAIPTLGSNSINTSGVAISSGTVIQSTTLTDFTTTTITANDIMAADITTTSGVGFIDAQVNCQ